MRQNRNRIKNQPLILIFVLVLVISLSAVRLLYPQDHRQPSNSSNPSGLSNTSNNSEPVDSQDNQDNTEPSALSTNNLEQEPLTPKPTDSSLPMEIQDLVLLTELDDSFVIDLRYATENNFTGQVIYTHPVCVIHKNTAQKLIAANEEFNEMGYRIKIWDAYRPYSAQQTLWDAASDKQYVGDPQRGSVHNRGAAVDVTLVDLQGNEIPMPTEFDEFSTKAHIDYDSCTQEEKYNRELLAQVMVRNGFSRISIEWWHFNDTNANDYPILDISLEDFIKDN